MKSIRKSILILSLIMLSATIVKGQFPSYYQHSVLLSDQVTGLLIGEASGERAYNHVVEMAGYARLRDVAEFSGDLMETEYLVNRLHEYGIDNVHVDRFGTTRSWQGVSASLWEMSPSVRKIADLVESPLMLASGSQGIDTLAEVVYADATMISSGFASLDVKGKIILTAERPGSTLTRAVQAGAAAVISYNSPRPLENSVMIPSSSAGGRGGSQTGTVFMISPREGESMKRRLLSGEKVVVRARAESTYVDAELQVTSCLIEGSNPGAGEIIITAHVFEGYVKTGGNDNISGSAAILEAARVLDKLITEGSIPRPERGIRFLWVPEFSGTVPWVAANRSVIDRALCNINLDMVGLSLSKWKSFFVLHRTSYGNAHYVGDVVESLFRYTGETNKVNSVVSGSEFFRPIVAPTGSEDPFYYEIESASGGSDHMVFNDLGVMVPGIMMITWPDPFYHTSEDLADKCDPTQLKRTVFITAGSAYAIAAAGSSEAIGIAGEVSANSLRRMGITQSMTSNMVAAAAPGEVNMIARSAEGKIRGTALGEILILNSVRELAPDDAGLNALIVSHIAGIRKTADEQVRMIAELASSKNRANGLPPYVSRQSDAEKNAAKRKPVMKLMTRDTGYRAYQAISSKIPAAELAKFNMRGIADPQEALKLADGKNSILDIKYILDAQYSRETSLESLTAFFNALEAVSVIGF
ncbi:MAG: M28 family peptidase [Bacteroidales bacterium]|nr:M28 family peptidase [Bacteroidales bacterium]